MYGDGLGSSIPRFAPPAPVMVTVEQMEEALALAGAAREEEDEASYEEALAFEEVGSEVDVLNREAMHCLREGKGEEALSLLTRAQMRLDRVEEDPEPRGLLAARAETASNLGTLHRKRKEYDVAIQCLQRALKFHRAAGAGPRTLAAAHLSLAACYVEQGALPAEALRQAQAAVELGGQVLLATARSGRGAPPEAEDCAILAVAYHKAAEAYEGLREWSKASHAYAQAYEVVRRSLGPHHHLTKTFERSTHCPRVIARARPFTEPAPLQGTPRRLPNIPRARASPPCGTDAGKYELRPDALPAWPPPSATQEEQMWYAMARKR